MLNGLFRGLIDAALPKYILQTGAGYEPGMRCGVGGAVCAYQGLDHCLKPVREAGVCAGSRL